MIQEPAHGVHIGVPAEAAGVVGELALARLFVPSTGGRSCNVSRTSEIVVVLAFMLGELEVSNLVMAGLVGVALIFLLSFAAVSVRTGELIRPAKKT